VSAPGLRLPGARDSWNWLAWLIAALAVCALGAAVAQHPRWALDAAFLVAAAAVIAWRPYAVLLLLVVLAPKESASTFLAFVTVIAGGAVLLVRARNTGGALVWVPWLILLVFALWRIPIHPIEDEGLRPEFLHMSITGIAYVPTPSGALIGWIRLAGLMVLFVLAAWTVVDLRRLRMLLWAVLIGAILPVITALNQLVKGEYVVRNGFKSVVGPFTFPNSFGVYLALVLLIGLAAIVEIKSTRRRALVVAILAGVGACLILTYTRNAWVGFAIGFIVMAALSHRRLVPIGLLALAIAAFAFPKQVDKVQSRFADLTGSEIAIAHNSLDWRTGEWNHMWKYGARHPFTGNGFGSFEHLTVVEFGIRGNEYSTVPKGSPPGTARGFSAHNDYLRMFVELGIAGVLLWASVLLGLLFYAVRGLTVFGLRPYAAVATGLVIALIAMSLVDNVMGYTGATAAAVAMTGGIVGVSVRSRAGARRARPATPPAPGSAG